LKLSAATHCARRRFHAQLNGWQTTIPINNTNDGTITTKQFY